LCLRCSHWTPTVPDLSSLRSLTPAGTRFVAVLWKLFTTLSSSRRLAQSSLFPLLHGNGSSIMAPEPSAASAPGSDSPIATPAIGPRDKVRLHFRKAGSLRWLSHHDLMRTFERMLRRADIPFRCTQGFHPHPRIVFALSLPLGVIGQAEIAEVELAEVVEPADFLRLVTAQCPSGLEILNVCRIPTNRSARVIGFTYGLTVPAERLGGLQQHLEEALRAS